MTALQLLAERDLALVRSQAGRKMVVKDMRTAYPRSLLEKVANEWGIAQK